MWTNVAGALILLVVLSFVVQWIFPGLRGKPVPPQRYVRMEVIPVAGFLGIILLALSLVQAIQRDLLYAWGLGDGLGFVCGIAVWLALVSDSNPPWPFPMQKKSQLRAAWDFVKTYGIFVILALVALNIATRWLGTAVEIFTAGAVGVWVITAATAVFVHTAVADKR